MNRRGSDVAGRAAGKPENCFLRQGFVLRPLRITVTYSGTGVPSAGYGAST